MKGIRHSEALFFLAWCFSTFSSTSAQVYSRHGNFSLPELPASYQTWTANWHLGSNPPGRGSTQSSLLTGQLLSWGCCPKSCLLCISWTRGSLWGLSSGASWICLRLGVQPSAGVKVVKDKKHSSCFTWWLKLWVWPGHEEGEWYPGLYLCAFPAEMEHCLMQNFGKTQPDLLSHAEERIKMGQVKEGLVPWWGEGEGCPRRGGWNFNLLCQKHKVGLFSKNYLLCYLAKILQVGGGESSSSQRTVLAHEQETHTDLE